MLRSQRFRRLFRQVYVSAALPDTDELRFDAAWLLLADDAVASHHTAARLAGLPVPDEPRLHVTTPPNRPKPRIDGVRARSAPVEGDVRTVRGRPVLVADRTFLDLAGEPGFGLVDLVVYGDAAVRRRLVTREQLIARADAGSGRGVRLARRAARLVQAKVDSPMETRLRMLLVLAGLPTPVLNRDVLDNGLWIARPDLQYPEQRIAMEYEGDHHRTERVQWHEDKTRNRMLRDAGWELLECTARDVYRFPRSTLDWVHERLVARKHPDGPATLRMEWQEYFGPTAR